jgi:hypothetical protein
VQIVLENPDFKEYLMKVNELEAPKYNTEDELKKYNAGVVLSFM